MCKELQVFLCAKENTKKELIQNSLLHFWTCICPPESAEGGCVTEKGNVLQHVPELPKVCHQKFLET